MLKEKEIEKEQDLITADLSEILDKSTSNILVLDFDIPHNIDNETRDIIFHLHNKIGLMLRSLLELSEIIDRVEVVRKMSKRYPWHGTSIKKSDHLRMSWFVFINYCYIYQAKQKKFSNQMKHLSRVFSISHSIDVANRIKKIKKGLRKYIVERGQLVHEWETLNLHVKLYGDIEFLARIGHEDYKNNEKHHYSDAKFFIGLEILSGLEFMIYDFKNNLSNDKKSIISVIDKFNDICTKAREHPERIKLSFSSAKSQN